MEQQPQKKEQKIMKTKRNPKKISCPHYCMIASCAVLLFLAGCQNRSDSEAGVGYTDVTSVSIPFREPAAAYEDAVEEVCRNIKEIDFSIQEHPIDTIQYDSQTDRIYKSFFLKAVTNQIPIQSRDGKKMVYYRDMLPNAAKMSEDEFLRSVRESDYFYMDFDGDGLPELTVNTEGPWVLKYVPEEETVVLHYNKEQGWNLLGAGQMIYHAYSFGGSADSYGGDDDGVSVIREEYAYETVDHGVADRNVTFYDIMTSKQAQPWVSTYKVSLDGDKPLEVGAEEWAELVGRYFTAKDLAPHPMSFEVLFGKDGSGGYMPGSASPARYLIEDRTPLPMNEETGEEWKMYQAILEGDFSLVEDEAWGGLQSRYESSLKGGGGRCYWDYFLMDFNQDGWKELYIRFNQREVNDTASFRYEDGKVKMWGGYNSADSHGYSIPLRNGKILSVSWYQDDKIMWIMGLDSGCRPLRQRCYSVGRTGAERDFESTGEHRDSERGWRYRFQDYYRDGELCGNSVDLSGEEWDLINAMIENLFIPESAWKSCSEFTPSVDRPPVPSVGERGREGKDRRPLKSPGSLSAAILF